MKIRKVLYVVLGCIGVGLGAVGAVLPLLPAFPFLLLAAVCFAKSSDRLHNWFTSTKLYKNNLESFVRGKGMTWKTKIRIMTIVTITMSVGFIMMSRVPVGRIILACVWVFHIFYFIFGIKTLKADGKDSLCMRILKVEGMKCENCVLRLECAYNKNDGMVAKADYPTKTVKVFLKNPEETKRLESIAADMGYKAKLLKETA